MEPSRKPYPTDVSDEEWEFVAPYLTLMSLQAPQRKHDLREIFNALRWIMRAGAPWRLLPNNFPPWQAVYQQTQRWIEAGCFEDMVHDLRELLRAARAEKHSPRRPSLTRKQSKPLQKAGTGLVTTVIRGRTAPKSTWPWIRWVICWR